MSKIVEIKIQVEVPDNAEYVAVDQDGEICSFVNIPFLDPFGSWDTDGEYDDSLTVVNWMTTLTKV